MVFVPDPRLDAATLGIDGSVPRSVPSDAIVGVLAQVVPSSFLQLVLLALVPVLSGWGVGRLTRSRPAAAAAATIYVWNPYVAERLVIGHWTFLLGWALLPWVVAAAGRARHGGRHELLVLLLWLVAAAAAGSTASLVAVGCAVVVLAWPGSPWPARLRRVGVVACTALLVNAVWWWPGLLRPGGIPSDPAGVDAFAARSDTPYGLAGSLLTMGGIWNPAVVPGERASWLLAGIALALVLICLAVGLPRVVARTDPPGGALLTLAVVSLVLAAAASIPPTEWLLRTVVADVPGGGLLRDGQKLLMPWGLVVALCVGETADRLSHARTPVVRPWSVAALVALLVLPVVVLPGLAFGALGRVSPTSYPTDWSRMRDLVSAQGDVGLALLPWNLYRRYGWNSDRVVLDPGPRYWPHGAVVNDELPLSTVTVEGEDERASALSGLVRAGDPRAFQEGARDLGVRLVLLDRSQPAADEAEALVSSSRRLGAHGDLVLYDLGSTAASAAPRVVRPAMPVGLITATVAAAVIIGASLISGGRRRGVKTATVGVDH